jgi:hypothetical protein
MSAKQRAMLGGVVWIAFVAMRVPHWQDGAWALALLLFAALVLVPLALELATDSSDPDGVKVLVALTRLGQLPAALLLMWACTMPAGGWAVLVAVPWVIVCGMVATTGWLRARRGGWRRTFDALCGDAAFIFLGVGGAWVFGDRAGVRPFNFDSAIVTLSAVHFHFAGLLLPLLAGLTVRALPKARLATRAAVGVVLGVPAVAVGIATTQFGWGTAMEGAAGCGLALAGMAVAVLHVRLATEPSTGSPMKRGLFFVAGVSLFFGMMLAAAYASRMFSASFAWLNVPWMRAVHGSVNALGFGLCGVLAWQRGAGEHEVARRSGAKGVKGPKGLTGKGRR